ncbi:pimeloyl-ACP methyl ester carboxylesterase [Streptomyces sp. SPB162]|nr:pimeloyl-ACP methyl ester carboxylesterase [Streptomyces sp. SPB162]
MRSLALVNARRSRYWSAMRSLRMPVYLMSGERDRLVPVRAARAAAARHPGWRFETFPGVGHAPQLEIPGVVAGRLLDWVDEALPAAGPARSGG